MRILKRMRFLIIAMLSLLCMSHYIKASDDLKWYEDRDEAFALAKEEGKYVFLLYGSTVCPYCNTAKEHISKAPINKIIQDNFILWFCDATIPEKQAQGEAYKAYYENSIIYPLICVIDPNNPMPALSYSTNRKNEAEILAILKANIPTANENVIEPFSKVYIVNNVLTISNEIVNEIISIYTISGQMLDSFDKKDNTMFTRNVGIYPKGILLVCSSNGWYVKVINQ